MWQGTSLWVNCIIAGQSQSWTKKEAFAVQLEQITGLDHTQWGWTVHLHSAALCTSRVLRTITKLVSPGAQHRSKDSFNLDGVSGGHLVQNAHPNRPHFCVPMDLKEDINCCFGAFSLWWWGAARHENLQTLLCEKRKKSAEAPDRRRPGLSVGSAGAPPAPTPDSVTRNSVQTPF